MSINKQTFSLSSFNELKEEATAILYNYQMTYQIASDILDKIESFFVPTEALF